MKKIFNVFAVLLLTGMIAAGFVSCSNASGGGGGSASADDIKQFIGKYKGTVTNGSDSLEVELNFKDTNGWESGWYRVEYSYRNCGTGVGLEDWQASGAKVYCKEDSKTHERRFEGTTSDNGATIDLDFYKLKDSKKWTGKVTKQ